MIKMTSLGQWDALSIKTLAGESGSRGGRREQITQFLLPPPCAAATLHALLSLPTDKCSLKMKGRGPWDHMVEREDQLAQHTK